MISKELAERLRKHYVGKICSILTTPFALAVDDKGFSQWFTMIVEDLDQECIFGFDISRKTSQVFFFGPQLIGISEEQVISSKHPDYLKLRNKIDEIKTKPDKEEDLQLPSPYISVDQLSKQAEQLNKKWK